MTSSMLIKYSAFIWTGKENILKTLDGFSVLFKCTCILFFSAASALLQWGHHMKDGVKQVERLMIMRLSSKPWTNSNFVQCLQV
jgi:hypothetical protein